MLTVGDRVPQFDLQAVVSTDKEEAFARINDKSDAGKWKVIFFWPKDFTQANPLRPFRMAYAEVRESNAMETVLKRLKNLPVFWATRPSPPREFCPVRARQVIPPLLR